MTKTISFFAIKSTILSILLVSSLGNVLAQAQVNQHIIHLKTGAIPQQPNARLWLDSMKSITTNEPILTYIHFQHLPTRAEKENLNKQGITLLEYLPENSYTAFVQLNTVANALNNNSNIYSIGNLPVETKADAFLWKKLSTLNETVEVLVSFYPILDAKTIKQFISTIGGQIHPSPMETYGAYRIIIDATQVRSMASWYGVQNISPASDMFPLDLQSRPAVKGNIAVIQPNNGGYGLSGDSVTVGVGDNASGIYHADIKDRITNFNPVAKANHGAHVNGIVGGAGNIDPLAEGMAPNVKLVDYLYDQVLPSTGTMLHDHNMTITNNSYGVLLGSCDYSGTYDGYSRFLDSIARQFPDVLHVFASGNDGYLSCSPYPPTFATVGGGYQPAKNIVVVGSMTDYLDQASDESKGPTKDGRLKPEIIAVGLGAYSTIGEDDYEWAAGTSMASPQVAGGLALLTQRFKQKNAGAQPQSDELKAILLNGAMDLGNPGPDFTYGFGSMDLSRSLNIIDNHRFFHDTINHSANRSSTINVPANTAQLKVMLYWNDVPAATSSSTQLVNDLDLTVSDPAGSNHLPLINDPSPGQVTVPATEKVDHLNNIEQVTINNPAAGNYSVKINGFNIPSSSQRYVIAYDFVPAGIQLTYPAGGDVLRNVEKIGYDTVRIFWNSMRDGHSFRIQFSENNGANWITLADSISADQRYFTWKPNNYNSSQCLMKITKNGTTESSTSGKFTINTEPIVVLDSVQCPGYINIHWKKIPNAGYYQMLYKNGAHMQLAGITADTFYTFKGMSIDKKSYIAVKPVINGVPGYRSVAAIVTANSGNCSNSVSLGDLMIEKVTKPLSGRMYTHSQKNNNDTIRLKVRNLYTAPCNSYSIHYQINSGSWQSYNAGAIIPANGTQTVNVPAIDLSAPGAYQFKVAISNHVIADLQHGNDTIFFSVYNLPNDTISLPFFDGFETMSKIEVSHDTMGLSGNAHWDFATNDSAGRFRSYVNEEITITGSRSVSMDENMAMRNGSVNKLTGTFNLSNYDTGTHEVRLDFDYVLHGSPKTIEGNLVTARVNDTMSWSPIYSYDFNAYPGTLNHAKSLSLTDAARFSNRNFSTSFQVQIGQNDTSLIAAPNFGNGMTFDNFKLYTVVNDAELVKVIAPQTTNCGLTGLQPLTVEIHNGVNYTLHNINLYYSMDSGTVYTGTIDSITAKKNLQFTFPQFLTIPAGTTHKLNIWLEAAGDSYAPNDSIIQYRFRNNPVITSYPYLENFEAGDGGYYSDGINNTWKYGTPSSVKINKAASGKKAWKTNLTGKYNNLEQSYLYSPCFEVISLLHPMLSFSAALDIENCGNTMCDKAFIEYTYDGINWTKLGTRGQGTNWYDSTFNVWNTKGFTRWHVASIPIPLPVGGGSTINFRFALNTDPGATFEGFAIDDIHIYDYNNSILPTTNAIVTQNLSGNNWVNFIATDGLISAVHPNNQTINNTTTYLFAHDTLANPGETQYTFPRSYKIAAPNEPTDSVGIRIFLTEQDVVKVTKDQNCPSCTKITDAYSLGVTQYNNVENQSVENNTLTDNTTGNYTYYPSSKIKWVPYSNGYFAEFKAKSLSEFWFNNGGPTGTIPAGQDYVHFTATRTGKDVNLNWQSIIDTSVINYSVLRSYNDTSFPGINSQTAKNQNSATYSAVDTGIFPNATVVFYKLKWTMHGTTDLFYSPVRRIDNIDSAGVTITFNATAQDRNTILTNWTSFTDGTTEKYILERAINNGVFDTIYNAIAVRKYGQRYNYTDVLTQISTGTYALHYRLTVLLKDGKTIVLPIQNVQIPDINSVPIIYPNPTTNNTFQISWYAEAGKTLQVNITDLAGKSIFKTSDIAKQWANKSTISLPLEAKGLFLVNMTINGMSYVGKLVFQ